MLFRNLVFVALLISPVVFAQEAEAPRADALSESSSSAERMVEDKSSGERVIEQSIAHDYVIDESTALIGQVASVKSAYEDTLVDIARIHGLGYEEIRLANPDVDVWLPGDGTEVRLPTQFLVPKAKRKGLVINIAEYRMYYFTRAGDDTVVKTFPISIGRMDWGTPLGRASIVKKVKSPSWYPPASIRAEWAADGRELAERVPPGPDNPLGDFAMRLSIPGYLIHGTNRPAGVGMRVTHGCIRMFPEDIEYLYPNIPVNTAVQIVNQPYKFGWEGDDLYLEVHPPLATAEDEVEGFDDPNGTDPWSLTSITELYIRVTDKREADVDWTLIDEVFEQRLGIPVKVGRARVPSGTVAAVENRPGSGR